MADEWTPTNPFEGDGGNHYEFTSTTAIDVNQVQQEISQVSGISLDDIMTSSSLADPDAPASEGNPVTIFVSAKMPLDQAKVQAAIDDHTPVVIEPVATDPSGVQITSDDPALPDLLTKLRDGATLTTKELSLVVKSIVGG